MPPSISRCECPCLCKVLMKILDVVKWTLSYWCQWPTTIAFLKRSSVVDARRGLNQQSNTTYRVPTHLIFILWKHALCGGDRDSILNSAGMWCPKLVLEGCSGGLWPEVMSQNPLKICRWPEVMSQNPFKICRIDKTGRILLWQASMHWNCLSRVFR